MPANLSRRLNAVEFYVGLLKRRLSQNEEENNKPRWKVTRNVNEREREKGGEKDRVKVRRCRENGWRSERRIHLRTARKEKENNEGGKGGNGGLDFVFCPCLKHTKRDEGRLRESEKERARAREPEEEACADPSWSNRRMCERSSMARHKKRTHTHLKTTTLNPMLA